MMRGVEEMKKRNNITLIVCIIIFIAIIIFLIINNLINSGNTLEELTWEQTQEKINNKEDFVIVLTQTTCSHCMEYKPILKKVAKNNNITIYYLDYDNYDEETANEILAYFNFSGDTPTTFFFKEGSEISLMSRISGTAKASTVTTALKKYGYIEETE